MWDLEREAEEWGDRANCPEPEEFALDYRGEDDAKHWNAMGVLRDDAVRELLNAECQERSPESTCLPWEVSETADWQFIECGDDGEGTLSEETGIDVEAMFEGLDPLHSCPLFYKADPREVGYMALLESECTVNEETKEALERLIELEEREIGR